ncbi:MAG: TIGR00730 family Rossman fold protein [Alphaproteobacteria bacterium]|nr:TIGR00730 family Rossman fold protein [Alphaproteobacteria bacterium]
MKRYKTITVFGSASGSTSSVHNQPMRMVGEMLAEKGITMAFGVGDEGMIGRVFQGVRNKNGRVIGVTTPKLLALQCKNPDVFHPGEIEIVPTLSVRKRKMFELGDAILVGPGGWGTIDEFAEFAVTIQTGEIPKKPMIFLNFNGFWDPLRHLILNMLQEGTLNQDKVDFIDFVKEADDIFPAIAKVQKRLDAARRHLPAADKVKARPAQRRSPN